MTGAYKVKHPAMKPLHAEAIAALRGFDRWRIRSVPRAENARADELVNEALDAAGDVAVPRRVAATLATVNDDPLTELSARLEEAAEQLRAPDVEVDAALALIEECARLASEASSQVDERTRAALEPLPDLPGQLPLPSTVVLPATSGQGPGVTLGSGAGLSRAPASAGGERCLESLRFATEPASDGLEQAMRYSLLAGGKRIRPVLALATASAIGRDPEWVLPLAVAIELIHTYSLIHDDLPAMDDDDLRRGRPTCHVAFGEDVAILAGDGLYAEAFVLLLSRQQAPPERLLAAAAELARATGAQGMVAGPVHRRRRDGPGRPRWIAPAARAQDRPADRCEHRVRASPGRTRGT